MSRPSLQSWFLLAISPLLAFFAVRQGAPWLLPAAGTVALLGLLQAGVLPWLGIAAVAAGIAGWLVMPPVETVVAVPWAVVALVLGTGCAFLGILSSLSKSKPAPLAAALERMAVTLFFLTAGLFLAAGWLPLPVSTATAWAFAGLGLVLAADTAGKLLARFFTPRRHWDTLPAPGSFFFFRWLGSEWRACLPAAKTADDPLTLRLAEMWMWPVLKSRLLPLVLAALVVTWLGSAVHQVDVGSKGIRQTAGRWDAAVIEPGFHLSLPWPLGKIETVDTGSVRETVLGFRSDPGQPILWERAHYEGEEMSLVGGGDDLLSISVPIHYRVADPAAWLRGSTDPEKLVRDAGNRILLDLTIRRSAAEVMTFGREEIRGEFHQRLQQELDSRQSGVRVVEICLRDVHPPVQAAPAYQDVVAALEEKEAMIHDGESYHRDFSIRARADAYALVTASQSAADGRVSRAQGEAARFNLRRDAWSRAPGLFELREGFRVFDETLADTKKAIFDSRMRGSMATQLDLRKVLNPDLIDNIPAAPESLVPPPSKSRDAFDLDIEGSLRMNRGEVPAVSGTPADPDNVLNSNEVSK